MLGKRLLLLAGMAAFAPAALGTMVYGLQSNAGPNSVDVSDPPTYLFSFDTGTNAYTLYGQVAEVNGQALDVDALAYNGGSLLHAFVLTANGSSLVSFGAVMNPTVTYLASFGGVDMRGAAFAGNGLLYSVGYMAGSWNLYQIDLTDFTATTFVGLSGGAITTGVDIAFDSSGQLWLGTVKDFYKVDIATGAMTLASQDQSTASIQNVGLAFDQGDIKKAYTFEVNGDDDLYKYDLSLAAAARSNYMLNIPPPGFNSGRGDLAVAAVPEPFTVGIGVAGLALGLYRRRRR